MPERDRPTIVDDFYWLKWAATDVDESIAGRNAAAEHLRTAIAWLWTVYSAAAIIGVAFSDRQFSSWQTLLVAAPILLLPIAYGLSTFTLMPIDKQYDPREPEQIKTEYHREVKEKRHRLFRALMVSGVAALSVVGACLATLGSNSPHDDGVSFVLESNARILLDGAFDADEEVVVTLDEGQATPRERSALYTADADGILREWLQVSAAGRLSVSAEWTNDQGQSVSVTEVLREE
jgi:hypothetical protein